MSQQSHHLNGFEDNKTYLVILKVYGHGVKLFNQNKSLLSNQNQSSFQLNCRKINDEIPNHSGTEIKVFVLSETAVFSKDESGFKNQNKNGQLVNESDLVLFMTEPTIDGSPGTYAIDINLSKKFNSSVEDDLNDSEPEDDFQSIGQALVNINPNVSSKGTQEIQILSDYIGDNKSVGQLQVEYLVVKNPIAYGKPSVKPDWLYSTQIHAGHRGSGTGCRPDLPGGLLENTIASFNYAHHHGADMCELDVLVSADGVPFVYHDYIVNAVDDKHSKDKLGTSPSQLDGFTLKQLRDFELLSMNDAEGSKYIVDVPGYQIDSKKPFPTLEQVLNEVDKTCALNIELKCPQILPNGKFEALHDRDINDYVDIVLKCIYQHANGRPILITSFNADVAIMLRFKQTKYPVSFITTGDHKRFNDMFTKTVINGIHFAQAFDLAGINPNAAYLTNDLVRYAQDRGQSVYAWGKINSVQVVEDLRRTGLNGLIYDKIDLIKPNNNQSNQSLPVD